MYRSITSNIATRYNLKNSGRYDGYVNDGTMLITESNKGTFCLAPTGEEAMLEFARKN